MTKRIISIFLALVMLASVAVVAGVSVSAEEGTIPAAKDYSLGATANDGLILQAWNWSYAEIQKNLDAIAEAGFTTIQISPPTELKEATKGVKVLQKANDNGWWMMYQPAAYELNQSEDNVLGTKDDLIKMIDAAHEKGLFVIADAVINHLGNAETGDYKIDPNKLPSDANAIDYLCERAWEFDSSKALIDANAFHYPYANCDYTDVGSFDATQNAVSLLPDLDTSNPLVQETILNYWQECIDAGIDGFRIDAAKHIETKYDGEYASDFWDNVMYNGVNGKQGIYEYAKDKYGKDLYMYGEILNTPSKERSYSWYLEYMNVTDSKAFYAICDAVNNGTAKNAVPATFNNGMTAETVILWDESHDTYMDGCKSNNVPSVNLLTKRWAVMASRKDVVAMYLARPTNTPSEVYNLDLGTAYDTAWNDPATVAINKFHNHFQGASEETYASKKIAVVERGDSGLVLVNCGGNAADAAFTTHNIKDGTYVDQITGNTFTVTDGKLSGKIGSTGVAVIYNPEEAVVTASLEDTLFTTDTIDVSIYANGTDTATYSINGGETVPFTGKKTLTLGADAIPGDKKLVGLLGDADTSGEVNVKDGTYIQKAVAKTVTLDETQNVLADANSDGVVNIKDATAIQKHVAKVAMDVEGIGEEFYAGNTGDVTLTLVDGSFKKTYTYTKTTEDKVYWIKFDNSETQWTHVYCYVNMGGRAGANNALPGLLMTKGEGDVWYYQVPEKYMGGTVTFSSNVDGAANISNLPTKDSSTGNPYGAHYMYVDGTWNLVLDDGSLQFIK